jgi:hypothetical protein
MFPQVAQECGNRDLNADGRLIIVVANELSNTLLILLSNAYWRPVAQQTFYVGRPQSVQVGDVNADGALTSSQLPAQENDVTTLLQ